MPRRHRRLAGRKPKRRSVLEKALESPVFRQRIKPNKKRSVLFDGFTSGQLRKLLEQSE